MTPTLYGRWQTRILLMVLLGGPITALFAWFTRGGVLPFILLGYALLFGLGWDLLYDYLQSWRWNRDWPPIFAFAAGLWEGGCLLTLSQLPAMAPAPPGVMPGVMPGIMPGIMAGGSLLMGIPAGGQISIFWLHYGSVFGATFLASLGLLHVLMPRWRYRGGQWL